MDNTFLAACFAIGDGKTDVAGLPMAPWRISTHYNIGNAFWNYPDEKSPAILAITIASPPGGIGERSFAVSRAYISQTDPTVAHQFLKSSGNAPPGCLSALTNSARNRCSD